MVSVLTAITNLHVHLGEQVNFDISSSVYAIMEYYKIIVNTFIASLHLLRFSHCYVTCRLPPN